MKSVKERIKTIKDLKGVKEETTLLKRKVSMEQRRLHQLSVSVDALIEKVENLDKETEE